VSAQETANNILIDLDDESQRHLLSDAGTAPVGIKTFHCNDGPGCSFIIYGGPPSEISAEQEFPRP